MVVLDIERTLRCIFLPFWEAELLRVLIVPLLRLAEVLDRLIHGALRTLIHPVQLLRVELFPEFCAGYAFLAGLLFLEPPFSRPVVCITGATTCTVKHMRYRPVRLQHYLLGARLHTKSKCPGNAYCGI